MSDFEQFSTEIRKATGPRGRGNRPDITYNLMDGYEYYREKVPLGGKNRVGRAMFCKIISEMNLAVMNEVINGKTIALPAGFGTLSIEKQSTKMWIDDNGKLQATKPVNMRETLKLWHEDEEARLKKTFVRYDEEFVFRITSHRKNVGFTNMRYIRFRPCRYFRQALKNKIINDKNYDTYERGKVDKFEGY